MTPERAIKQLELIKFSEYENAANMVKQFVSAYK